MVQTSEPKTTSVQVKKEKIDAGNNGESDDGDGNGDDENNLDQSDEKGQAERVYKHAMKILKFKMYFEDFFPTDDDRASLTYDCWMAGAKVTKGFDADHATTKWMLYHFKYDKTVRNPCPTVLRPTTSDQHFSWKRGSAPYTTFSFLSLLTPSISTTRQLRRRLLLSETIVMCTPATRYVFHLKFIRKLMLDSCEMQNEPANTSLLYRHPLIADILKNSVFSGRDTLPNSSLMT